MHWLPQAVSYPLASGAPTFHHHLLVRPNSEARHSAPSTFKSIEINPNHDQLTDDWTGGGGCSAILLFPLNSFFPAGGLHAFRRTTSTRSPDGTVSFSWFSLANSKVWGLTRLSGGQSTSTYETLGSQRLWGLDFTPYEIHVPPVGNAKTTRTNGKNEQI
jgi:hypothetical protein